MVERGVSASVPQPSPNNSRLLVHPPDLPFTFHIRSRRIFPYFPYALAAIFPACNNFRCRTEKTPGVYPPMACHERRLRGVQTNFNDGVPSVQHSVQHCLRPILFPLINLRVVHQKHRGWVPPFHPSLWSAAACRRFSGVQIMNDVWTRRVNVHRHSERFLRGANDSVFRFRPLTSDFGPVPLLPTVGGWLNCEL